MRSLISSTVTVEDLSTYFKGMWSASDKWEQTIKDGGIKAWCRAYTVECKPKGIMYNVDISSVDDSSDAESKVTDKPVDFIIKFLGTGTSGDEHFEKRSSLTPKGLSSLLNNLANSIDDRRVGRHELTKIIRRSLISTDIESVRRVFKWAFKNVFADAREDLEIKDLAHLKSEMMDKGWKVSVDQDDRDLPLLTVDIGGIYKAKITVDHISWDYLFEVNLTDTHDSGTTDDPIKEFRQFYHESDVVQAKDEQKRIRVNYEGNDEVDPHNKTTPSRKGEPEEGTVRVPKGRKSDN